MSLALAVLIVGGPYVLLVELAHSSVAWAGLVLSLFMGFVTTLVVVIAVIGVAAKIYIDAEEKAQKLQHKGPKTRRTR